MNIHRAYYSYYILNAYKEYFSQDRLLYKFYKQLGNTLVNNIYDDSIILSPLYILYFFLLVHRKFLSIILNIDLYKPFINFAFDENRNSTENEQFEKITDGDTGNYLFEQNNAILNHLKNILDHYDKGKKVSEKDDFLVSLKIQSLFYLIFILIM